MSNIFYIFLQVLLPKLSFTHWYFQHFVSLYQTKTQRNTAARTCCVNKSWQGKAWGSSRHAFHKSYKSVDFLPNIFSSLKSGLMQHKIQLPKPEGFHVNTFEKVFDILCIVRELIAKCVIFKKKGNVYS